MPNFLCSEFRIRKLNKIVKHYVHIINKSLTQKNNKQHFFECALWEKEVSRTREMHLQMPVIKWLDMYESNQVERKQFTLSVNLIKVRHCDILVFSDILSVKNKVFSFI